MKSAVRYFSRSGNTKAVAEAIAKAAGTEAVSVDADDAALTEPVDILFVGGALYAYGIDARLRDYLVSLDPALVQKAAVFSTSWLSKHAIDLIKNVLVQKGIPVADNTLYFRGHPSDAQLRSAADFVRSLS
ncbi:MAG: flavodoxin domain-containing protein [Parafannyhessea sp.]|uniref:flavodoxin domain-containing protein n=1 Tax=Parafannyhessea sp. TaxID=2847324 RepID=UPI003EFE6E03